MNKPPEHTANTSRKQSHRILMVGAIMVFAAPLAPCLATGTTVAARNRARAARSLTANDEAHLRYVRESGSSLTEEGYAAGTLPGTVRVRLDIGAVVEASFTLYPRGGGSLSGRASGTLRSSGLYASFGGTMSVSSGTGRYRHARGRGGFYGTLNRQSLAAVVQTRGTLRY